MSKEGEWRNRVEADLLLLENRGFFSGYVLAGHPGEVELSMGVGSTPEGGVPGPRDVYHWGSLTKVLTALATTDLFSQGILAPDQTLDQFFPDLPGGKKITLDHLLSHTSGLAEVSHRWNFWFELGQEQSFDRQYRWIASTPPKAEPGSLFEYNNSGYILLGKILSLTEGKPYPQVIRERVTAPLGLESVRIDQGEFLPGAITGWLQIKPFPVRGLREHPSVPFSAGAAAGTPEDLFRFASAALSGQVPGWDAITRPRARVWEGMNYGWGLFTGMTTVAGSEKKIQWHSGGFGGFSTMVSLYPEEGLIIIVLANIRNPFHWFIGEEVEARIAEAYFSDPRR